MSVCLERSYAEAGAVSPFVGMDSKDREEVTTDPQPSKHLDTSVAVVVASEGPSTNKKKKKKKKKKASGSNNDNENCSGKHDSHPPLFGAEVKETDAAAAPMGNAKFTALPIRRHFVPPVTLNYNANRGSFKIRIAFARVCVCVCVFFKCHFLRTGSTVIVCTRVRLYFSLCLLHWRCEVISSCWTFAQADT